MNEHARPYSRRPNRPPAAPAPEARRPEPSGRMEMPRFTSPRQAAAWMLGHWIETQDYPDRWLGRLESGAPVVQEILYGAVRRWRSLDWVLGQCVPRPPPPPVQGILLGAAYELLYMNTGAPHAVVNEAAENGRALVGEGMVGLINAVLRKVSDGRDLLLRGLQDQPVGIAESHPDQLIRRWEKAYGVRDTRRLCEWNNRRAELTLRVSADRTTVPQLQMLIRQAGGEAAPHPADPERFLTVTHSGPVASLPGYDQGWFYAQDPSTALSVDLLDPRPGDWILDACASPGGKTVHIAERLNGQGRLVAADCHADRLHVLRENLRRMGQPDVRVMKLDATQIRRPQDAGLDEDGGYDAILLDVPCTNTGVLRRRPDARWNFSLSRLDRLRVVQRELLEATVRVLRPGGRLVYSTCSMEPEEDEGQVDGWLRVHPEFKLVKARKQFPPRHETDGAYAALLVRSKA